MSIEVFQFPNDASAKQLRLLLEELGFAKGKSIFNPSPPGTINLFWADPLDFKSTSGVDAAIIPLDDEGKRVWNTRTNWGLRTRTSILATSFDKEFQNAVVRRVRQDFGGFFYNDHFGRNRYTVVEREWSTPATRGVYALWKMVEGELDALEYCLPKEIVTTLSTPRGDIMEENDAHGVLRISKQLDPTRVLYNALVPFLVAAVEHFFRGCFEILLKYSLEAQSRVDQSRKITYTDAAAVSRGDLTLERIASDWYSFQNLDSIQKAYKDVLQIDVRKVIRKRRKVREKLPLLDESLINLIQSRHGVVHHFAINRRLDRNEFIDLLHLVRTLIELMAREIERGLGVKLGPG